MLARLISGELMLADVDAMGECSPCGAARDGLHLR
jgi:hypothetical protein